MAETVDCALPPHRAALPIFLDICQLSGGYSRRPQDPKRRRCPNMLRGMENSLDEFLFPSKRRHFEEENVDLDE
jgi:hypothetical protein